MANWQYSPPMGLPQQGNAASYGAGGYGIPGMRSYLDQARCGGGRIPNAEYPDGYLGSIINRRSGRLDKSLTGRLGLRDYTRGVHKGTRIDPRDYFWDEDFNPNTGLEYEAAGLKWTATGEIAERLTTAGALGMRSPREMNSSGGDGVSDEVSMRTETYDPIRAARLSRLAPNWSW